MTADFGKPNQSNSQRCLTRGGNACLHLYAQKVLSTFGAVEWTQMQHAEAAKVNQSDSKKKSSYTLLKTWSTRLVLQRTQTGDLRLLSMEVLLMFDISQQGFADMLVS